MQIGNAAVIQLDVKVQPVAAQGIVALGDAIGVFQFAEIPRMAVVVDDDFLVEGLEVKHHANISRQRFNPCINRSISARVL